LSLASGAVHPAPIVGVVSSLLPIFLLVGLGAALTAGGFLTPSFLRSLNRLAYYVGMPGLLFVGVSRATALDTRPLLMSAVVLGSSLFALVLAYPIARLVRLPHTSVGTFVQSAFRGNLAFVGLPIVLHVFARPDAPASLDEIVPVVAMAIAPVMIAYNVLAVVVLVTSHQKINTQSLRFMARQVATNPLVLAVAAGLVAALAGLRLPAPLETTLQALGGLAIPAALFGVGGTIVLAPLRERLAPAAVAAAIKIVVTPLCALGLTTLLGLSRLDAVLAVMLCTTPTAAASFIMSTQMRGDPALASSAIALSTLASVGSLALALSFLPGS
jgi:predicted permease